MRRLNRFSAAFILLLISCIFETKVEKPADPGFVSLDIRLQPGLNALLKTASADTIFSLDKLHILLTSNGSDSQSYAYALTGRPDTGSISVSPQLYALASLREWQACILVIDTSATSVRSDTVYRDSVTFTVQPGDTAFVNKALSPAFSILRTRMVSNNPAGLTNNIKWLRLRIDGATVDSTPVGPRMNAVTFGSNTAGTAVGAGGVMVKSSDAGVTWTETTSGTTANLNGVAFPSATTGFAVGDGGVVLRTTNGTLWSLQTSGTTQKLNGVHFRTTSKGYAVGQAGTIKLSNGTTWSNPGTNPATADLNEVHASSNNNAYAVGNNGTILRTTNSGSSWTTVTSGTTLNLNSVFFTGTNAGYAVGDSGLILKTSTGTSWSRLTSGTTKKLTGVFFVSSTTGYAVGEAGTVLRTTNGTAWSIISVATKQNLNAIWWTSNVGAATTVGDLGSFASSSNGTSWTTGLLGTKSFDQVLTFKYLEPYLIHSLVMDAVDVVSGTLRGYQATKLVTITPGKDSTVTPNSTLSKCGYTGFPTCL